MVTEWFKAQILVALWKWNKSVLSFLCCFLFSTVQIMLIIMFNNSSFCWDFLAPRRFWYIYNVLHCWMGENHSLTKAGARVNRTMLNINVDLKNQIIYYHQDRILQLKHYFSKRTSKMGSSINSKSTHCNGRGPCQCYITLLCQLVDGAWTHKQDFCVSAAKLKQILHFLTDL